MLTINIPSKDGNIEVGIDEAKEMYDELKSIFEKPERIVYDPVRSPLHPLSPSWRPYDYTIYSNADTQASTETKYGIQL